MIDFKFHVVSLIAVFMALAVGILLGAGPLGGALGDTLRGQVQDLRTEREAMREELNQTRADLESVDALLEDGGPRLVDGTLEGGRVALIEVPGTDGEDLEAVRESLIQADAEIVIEAAVTETLVSPSQGDERLELLAELAPDAGDDADPVAALGQVIADALTVGRTETTGIDDAAEDGELLDLLRGSGEGLVTIPDDPLDRADVVVVVGPRATEDPEIDPTADADEDGTADADAEAAERRLLLTTALQAVGAMAEEAPTVLVGAAESERDLVGLLREQPELAPTATTVDSVGSVSATVVTPLAVAVTLDDVVAHYGLDAGADAVLPPAVATPLERRTSEAPTTGEGESPTAGTEDETSTAGTGSGSGSDTDSDEDETGTGAP